MPNENTKVIGITLKEDMLNELDTKRGNLSRSNVVTALIEKWIKGEVILKW